MHFLRHGPNHNEGRYKKCIVIESNDQNGIHMNHFYLDADEALLRALFVALYYIAIIFIRLSTSLRYVPSQNI